MIQIQGNYGKLLDVDLNTGEFKDYIVPKEYYDLFIGGKGLGARLLWDLLPNEGIQIHMVRIT